MILETLVKKQLEHARSNANILDLRSLKIESIKNAKDSGIELQRKVIKKSRPKTDEIKQEKPKTDEKPNTDEIKQEKAAVEQEKKKEKIQIEQVEVCTLTFDELSSVKVLRLSYNNIEKFDFKILKQLSSLEKLDLSHNKLSEIQNQENTSPTLLELYLHKNNIKQMEIYGNLKYFQNLQVLRIDFDEICQGLEAFDTLDSIIGEKYAVSFTKIR